jgi:predicted nucleic acid-binding Zn ribbon protein
LSGYDFDRAGVTKLAIADRVFPSDCCKDVADANRCRNDNATFLRILALIVLFVVIYDNNIAKPLS